MTLQSEFRAIYSEVRREARDTLGNSSGRFLNCNMLAVWMHNGESRKVITRRLEGRTNDQVEIDAAASIRAECHRDLERAREAIGRARRIWAAPHCNRPLIRAEYQQARRLIERAAHSREVLPRLP